MSSRLLWIGSLERHFLVACFLLTVPGVTMLTLASRKSYSTAFVILLATVSLFAVILGVPPLLKKAWNLARRLQLLHFAWILLFASALVFRIRDIGGIREDLLDFWAVYRIVLVVSAASILAITCVGKGWAWLELLRRPPFIFFALFVLWSAASTLWSVAPAWTLYKSLEIAIDACVVAAALFHYQSSNGLKFLSDLTWLLLASLLLSVWVGALFFEEAVQWGVGQLGVQVFGVLPAVAANTFGDLGAIVCLISVSRILLRRRFCWGYGSAALIGFASLVLSYSRTPFAAFLVSLMVLLWLVSRHGFLVYVLCGLVLASLMLLMPVGEFVVDLASRGQSEEALWTLTGRTYFWEAAWSLSQERHFGYGAYAGTRFQLPVTSKLPITSSVDNEWLEVLSGTGYPGVLLLGITVLSCAGRLVRSLKASTVAPLSIELTVLFSYILLRSVFVTFFLVWHPAMIFLLCLAFASLSGSPSRSRHRSSLLES